MTTGARRGELCALRWSALAAFVYSFNDGPDATGVDRLIVSERRRAIGGQRRDYLAAMAADAKATGWSPVFETAGPQPTDQVVSILNPQRWPR
jgi:hypothetical protein